MVPPGPSPLDRVPDWLEKCKWVGKLVQDWPPLLQVVQTLEGHVIPVDEVENDHDGKVCKSGRVARIPIVSFCRYILVALQLPVFSPRASTTEEGTQRWILVLEPNKVFSSTNRVLGKSVLTLCGHFLVFFQPNATVPQRWLWITIKSINATVGKSGQLAEKKLFHGVL